MVRGTRSVCPGGPVVPWSRGPVWPPSGPVPRPQPGLDHGSQDPDSVARETPSVCPRGPIVPSGPRLAPVYTRTRDHTVTHTHTLTHSHTHALTHSHTNTRTHAHTHTLTHSHTRTLTHFLALFLLFGVHAPVSYIYMYLMPSALIWGHFAAFCLDLVSFCCVLP